MTTTYEFRARRPSDFSLLGGGHHEDEREAYNAARRLYADGYDVTVTLVTRKPVAEWTQGDDE